MGNYDALKKARQADSVASDLARDAEDDDIDPMAAISAWVVRMAARYGPKVWDQQRKIWLSWEMALTKHMFGDKKTWMLNVPVWDQDAVKKAMEWEFGSCWPDWAVKAHMVDTRPCEWEDHSWVFKTDADYGPRLECVDPCDEPRLFCDNWGRYIFPACQNIPDLDSMVFEVPVKLEWVYHDHDDWWLELIPDVGGTHESR